MDWEELIQSGEAAELVLQFEKAALFYSRAMETSEGYYHACRRLAALRLKTGDVPESIRFNELTIQSNTADYLAASSLLYAKQCLSEATPEEIFRAHLAWAETFTSGLNRFPDYPVKSFSGRKRKIGFISPDFFHRHPVLSFFEPILDYLDRSKFELYLYSCCQYPDSTTQQLLSKADCGRQFSPQSLPEASVQIWEDQLDLLIDLAGHSSNHTLMVLAAKPCRRQCTYLGYPNTTGLKQVDYRMVDKWSDPPGLTNGVHTERLIRFEECAWCFSPPSIVADTNSAPLEQNEFITFGCFNNLAKFSNELLAMWRRILETVASARFLIKAGAFVEEAGRKRMSERLAGAGLPLERIILQPSMSYDDHLRMYRQMDIALDTYPYNGTTTTCEAMWMGVPVVTRSGSTHISRVGSSLLRQAGMEEFIADSAEDYIRTAVELARDSSRIRRYHLHLRESLKRSILLNPQSFMLQFEHLLIQMME